MLIILCSSKQKSKKIYTNSYKIMKSKTIECHLFCSLCPNRPNTRDENPTEPGSGPGPKTLIFGNFKNPERGPKPEYDYLKTLNPNSNPKFKFFGPAENPVNFFCKTKIGEKTRKQKSLATYTVKNV